MGWVYGRILGGIGESFVVILDLKWMMASRLDSDMIFGVRIRSLRKPLCFYLVLFHKECFCCDTRGIFWR